MEYIRYRPEFGCFPHKNENSAPKIKLQSGNIKAYDFKQPEFQSKPKQKFGFGRPIENAVVNYSYMYSI